MEPKSIEDVSEILDSFNIGDISSLLEKQLDLSENLSVNMTDYFKPLHLHYTRVMEDPSIPDDVKGETKERFFNVCRTFIKIISEKFNLVVDTNWMIDHEGDLPGLATALYNFFVKDIVENIQEVCINYIQKNKAELFEMFEEWKNKKYSMTLVNKKNYPLNMAVILANIYDVTTFILSALSGEQYIQYMNQDYIPLRVVYPMLQEGNIAGEFIDVISEMYTENWNLRASVCYQILTSYKVVESQFIFLY